MRREIKFRGKRLGNGVWIYGDLIHIDKSDIGIVTDYDHWQGCRVDLETIGQFTSLYDKNKKEIYEGDILKVQGTREKIEVRFVRGVFAFLWNGNLDDEAPINAPTQEWAEVIGNIHDNPKLLKRKK